MSDYQLLCGDAVQVLKTLPSGSVQCCVTSPPYYGLRSYLPDGHPDKEHELGAEDTPEAYVSRMVEVFREVRRVLHPSGVCFVNIGDSYYNYRPGNYDDNRAHAFGGERDNFRGMPSSSSKRGNRLDGLKEKDLIGIPWMLAFALRADGWWLRSAITWCKGNPMPESVLDRPTSATEQVFLLAKSSSYFYDADAIREPYNPNSLSRYKYEFGHGSAAAISKSPAIGNGNGHSADPNAQGRNRRNWWLVNSEPYSGSHYAVMPTKLVEPCVLAGTSAKGCCAGCGSPWKRVVEREVTRQGNTDNALNSVPQPNGIRHGLGQSTLRSEVVSATVDWQPTCTCNADIAPCVVLDPFFGSGTTGAVALKHGRRFVGIDLDERNLALAHKRIGQSQPMLFSEVL